MANAITLSGTPISAAASPNPDLCRISGYLVNAHGQALKGWSFVLRYCYSPLALDPGTLVLQERLTIKADKDGYVEFDLLRGAKVVAEYPNLLTTLPASPLTVPDAASADLLGFLFPYVTSVDWEDSSPLALAVDEGVTLSLLGTLTNGETVPMTASSVQISSSNEAVIKQKEGLAYLAVGAGSATLTLDSVDVSGLSLNQDREGNDIAFLGVPAPTLAATPLSVTVS